MYGSAPRMYRWTARSPRAVSFWGSTRRWHRFTSRTGTTNRAIAVSMRTWDRASRSECLMSSKPCRQRIAHAGTGALVALLSMLSACSSLQVFGKRDSEERARQIDVLQLRVMQFADEYVSRIIGPLNDIQT